MTTTQNPNPVAAASVAAAPATSGPPTAAPSATPVRPPSIHVRALLT